MNNKTLLAILGGFLGGRALSSHRERAAAEAAHRRELREEWWADWPTNLWALINAVVSLIVAYCVGEWFWSNGVLTGIVSGIVGFLVCYYNLAPPIGPLRWELLDRLRVTAILIGIGSLICWML